MPVDGSSRELSPDDIATPLAAFLAQAGKIFVGDLERAADHVHYAASQQGTLVGSVPGRAVWESQEGRNLRSLLLSDPALGVWFGGGDVRQGELRAILASVIRSWGGSNRSAVDYALEHAGDVLQALRKEEWSCWSIGVAYGVAVHKRVDLPMSYSIDPSVDNALANLVANDALAEQHVMRMSKGFGCLFLYGASASRNMFGPYAGTTAMAWGRVAFEKLKKCVWLASGVLPVIGDWFVTDVSPYPIVPFRHFTAPVQNYPTTAEILEERELDLLGQTILRLECMQEGVVTLDPETELRLRLALSHVDTVFRLADPLLTALLVHVALEGLLLDDGDEKSRLGPRLSWLIGRDTEERRAVRRFVSSYGEVRGALGHGKPPDHGHLGRMIGRPVSQDEVDVHFSWAGHEAGRVLEARCTEILRRALFSFLAITIEILPGKQARAALTRSAVIDGIEAVAANDPASAATQVQLESNAVALFAKRFMA